MGRLYGPSPASDAVFRAAADALEARRPFALCTVVDTKGSAPQQTGARMVVYPDGSIVGTIGGGRIEWTIIGDARRRLADGATAALVDIDLTELGMSCGGRMIVFVDVLLSHERLLVFGAGHVGRAVAGAASALGFHVVVVDDRPEWADPTAFPPDVEVVAEGFDAWLDRYDAQADDYAVIVTRGHEHDEAVLRRLVSDPLRYVGMMGSRRKVAGLLKRLRDDGIAEDALTRVDAPIGLPIGAVTPAELAISICAALVARRRGADAGGTPGVGDDENDGPQPIRKRDE